MYVDAEEHAVHVVGLAVEVGRDPVEPGPSLLPRVFEGAPVNLRRELRPRDVLQAPFFDPLVSCLVARARALAEDDARALLFDLVEEPPREVHKLRCHVRSFVHRIHRITAFIP